MANKQDKQALNAYQMAALLGDYGMGFASPYSGAGRTAAAITDSAQGAIAAQNQYMAQKRLAKQQKGGVMGTIKDVMGIAQGATNVAGGIQKMIPAGTSTVGTEGVSDTSGDEENGVGSEYSSAAAYPGAKSTPSTVQSTANTLAQTPIQQAQPASTPVDLQKSAQASVAATQPTVINRDSPTE